MSSTILIRVFCLMLFMLTVVLADDNKNAVGGALGLMFGTIIILGIWRYIYFENIRKLEHEHKHRPTGPLAHRIDH